MFGPVRRFVVASLVICLVAVPWRNAAAAETSSEQQPASGRLILPMDGLLLDRLAAAGDAKNAPRALNQAVASTSQHNFVLGATAAALVVGGVALIAYSTTPSCKKGQVSAPRCDRDKVLGAVGISSGAIVLVLWALSK